MLFNYSYASHNKEIHSFAWLKIQTALFIHRLFIWEFAYSHYKLGQKWQFSSQKWTANSRFVVKNDGTNNEGNLYVTFAPIMSINYVSGVRILKRRESVDVDDKVFVNFVTQYSVKWCTVKHRSFGTISIGEWLYLIIQLTFKSNQATKLSA